MKRIKDEVCQVGCQFKRPFMSSCGNFNGNSSIPGGGGGGSGGGGVGVGAGTSASHKLTTNDALTYLKEVKDMFVEQKDKYELFLEVMKDFKAQRTDTTGVIARVKELFKGHNNLILGFNTFLPKGYEITSEEDETPPKRTVEFDEAINFVNKIKRRFQNDNNVYKSFLDVLNMYRKELKDINEVYSEVSSLFNDHPDLLDEFTRFLPDASVNGQSSFPRINERSSSAPNLRQMQGDKQCRRDKVNVDHDLSVDCPKLEDDKSMKVNREHRKHAEKENKDWRNRDHDDSEADYDNHRDFIMQRYAEKSKNTRKGEGFGANANFPSYDDKGTLKGMYGQGFVFCEKVKDRLCSTDDYQAFLKCLNIYSNGIIKRSDLQKLVTDLLGRYQDLMDEFNNFLENCENIDGFLAGLMSRKSVVGETHLSRSLKVDDKEFRQEVERGKEKEKGREKYTAKSIQELDLSNCQRCTPSYRLLPDDYPKPSASQRPEIGDQVLNDHWVSVTSGSEDYSFKHMRRNQYEESLFRCEDDRFELDMLLESVSSTAKRAEELLNSIDGNKLETLIHIEEHFTALNLRCIERLYGDHGLDVMDILRKNPTLALPVILTRLKQKEEEWTRCQSDFSNVWAEIYAKNHHKSLDHRSFYFKQQDSKNLGCKSLVAEIKEQKEKKQKDDFLLTIAAGNRQPIVPHLGFEYSDICIHEDLYKLVQYSCKEICSTKEQLNKVMKLFTTFLEPMLGVSSQLHGLEGTEDAEEVRNPAINGSASGIAECDGSRDGDANVKSLMQLKSVHGEEDNLLSKVSSCRAIFGNEDKFVKEDNSLDVGCTCRDNPIYNAQLEKDQTKRDVTDRMPGFNKHASSVQVANVNVCFAIGEENCHGKTNSEMLSGCGAVVSKPADDISKVELLRKDKGGDVKSALLENKGFSDRVSKSEKESFEALKFEKEEGELSPNGDFEEDNYVVSADFGGYSMPKANHDAEGGEYHSGNREKLPSLKTRVENVDADDENSENAFEAGDEVFASESPGDECSREEHAKDDEVDDKVESEGEVEEMADGHLPGGDGMSLPLSERFLFSVKPLAKHVHAALPEERKHSRIFYGNDDFYVLFRLHQTLYERILYAKMNSAGIEMKWKTSKDGASPDLYDRFMSALYNLLDGSSDNTKFEDECRAIIGNQSYVLFTMDKLIYRLIKQLQTVAIDEMDDKLFQLHDYEKSRKDGKIVDSIYYENACVLLHEENIYRLECSPTLSCLTIQLMDNLSEKPEVFAVSIDPNFAAYLHDEFLSIFPGRNELPGIILDRNKRKYASLDELSAASLAMEGAEVVNGLECKISCASSKTSYVLDTEDFFIRSRRKRNPPGNRCSAFDFKRVHRFQKFLNMSSR